jgi:hypothetical protein
MCVELDHLFVCVAKGAPEAEVLLNFGLREGMPNRHPGQGTANRRFPFANAMIELIWVDDAIEAQSADTRRTMLWERWRDREGVASPFGICVRPRGPDSTERPFPGWEYRPAYLPGPHSMLIGEAGVEEPMWVHLAFMSRANREESFVGHPIGIREITSLTLTTPAPLRSAPSQKIVESKILAAEVGRPSLFSIEFDNRRRSQIKDFRPHLPLVFHY